MKTCERCGGAILAGVTGYGGVICTCFDSYKHLKPVTIDNNNNLHDEIQQLRNRVAELEEANKLLEADGDVLEQALTDPENQPSQFGTVPLEWYEGLESKLERMRFKVGEVIDSLDGSYEKHATRKALQEAIE